MSSLAEDAWINGQAAKLNVSELEDCSIAVDATYYIRLILDTRPSHEPLLPALGGLTGLAVNINNDLDQWAAHKIVPFFIFDGQSLHGQDAVSVRRGKLANQRTDEAWNLYSQGEAEQAVEAFGANNAAFRVQDFYPTLQKILRERSLHFLVAPYNASSQIAYFEMVDSDQCAGIMGSQELLLYPINDAVIKSIDWTSKQVTAIFKKSLIRTLNVTEATFVDSLLMTGTSFLPTYPPLLDAQYVRNQPPTVNDAVNMLRTADKSVANSCSAFSDVLQQSQDPDWLDKYRRALMTVMHFAYIEESGEVKAHGYDTLTKDNLQYMGLQLPEELYHYLNTGLVGGRLLSTITHLQVVIPPTLEGSAPPEYRKLVTNKLVPVREQTLALIVPRLNRWISRQDVTLKVWFDDKFALTLNPSGLPSNPTLLSLTWDIREEELRTSHLRDLPTGSIEFEVLSLLFPEYCNKTFSTSKRIRGIDTADEIVALTIWRFLHIRGYIGDDHTLTAWGSALAQTILTVSEWAKQAGKSFDSYGAILLAFELVRFGVLGADNQEGPSNGTSKHDADEHSSLLIAQCTSLLKLQHEANGYTGPLSKTLLYFRSLTTAVQEADRDLVEAVLASMFLHSQARRERDDYHVINQKLPFSQTPDIALGIAVKIFLAEISPSDSIEERQAQLKAYPEKFVPNALNFPEDLETALVVFDAIHDGVSIMGDQISTADRDAWKAAKQYRDDRKF